MPSSSWSSVVQFTANPSFPPLLSCLLSILSFYLLFPSSFTPLLFLLPSLSSLFLSASSLVPSSQPPPPSQAGNSTSTLQSHPHPPGLLLLPNLNSSRNPTSLSPRDTQTRTNPTPLILSKDLFQRCTHQMMQPFRSTGQDCSRLLTASATRAGGSTRASDNQLYCCHGNNQSSIYYSLM